MIVTRENLSKIGVKDVQRAWKIRAPDARHVMTDARCAGLMLITNSRSQTWSVEYRPRGADLETGKRFPTRSVTIGTPATHSPDSALAEALKIKGATKTGKDPAAERRATIAEAARARSATVERAVSDYLATLPTKEKKGGGRISERWAAEQEYHLRGAVAALGIAASPVESVDVATVRRLQHGPAYRHRFGTLSRFLDWAVHEERLSANPCSSIGRAYRPAAGGKRERTPTLKEIATIWRAVEVALDASVFRDLIRFAICIPARRGEIINLDWRHLDLEEQVWRQPSRLTKNREPHELRLHPLALEILTRRREEAGRPRAGLVFPSPRAGAPITAFSKMLSALHRATSGMEPWSPHDLRRSFASTLGQIGEDDEATIDAVLNHKRSASRGGVVGTYNRSMRLPAQAEALQRWGALVKDAIEGKLPDEPAVIPFARRAWP
jgi:integrase